MAGLALRGTKAGIQLPVMGSRGETEGGIPGAEMPLEEPARAETAPPLGAASLVLVNCES